MDQKAKKAAEIYSLSRNLITTLQILTSDVRHAEHMLAGDKPNEQFWRRMIIRAVCALGEGTLNSMKGMLPKSAEFFGVALTAKETAILTEIKKLADGSTRPFFLPIQDNLKETFKLFARIHGVQTQVKYDQGYEDFYGVFTLRNRLMHPRSHLDLEIKDDNYRASIRGWNWFNSTLSVELRECGKKLPFAKNT